MGCSGVNIPHRGAPCGQKWLGTWWVLPGKRVALTWMPYIADPKGAATGGCQLPALLGYLASPSAQEGLSSTPPRCPSPSPSAWPGLERLLRHDPCFPHGLQGQRPAAGLPREAPCGKKGKVPWGWSQPSSPKFTITLDTPTFSLWRHSRGSLRDIIVHGKSGDHPSGDKGSRPGSIANVGVTLDNILHS